MPCPSPSRRSCPRCERLPELDSGGARQLWLAFPIEHVRRKAERALRTAGHWFEVRDGESLVVYVAPAELHEVVRAVGGALGAVEQRDVTAVLTDGGRAPGVLDLQHVTTLARLVAQDDARWLTALLREERLTTHFQPVYALEDDALFGFESLTRGVAADGALLPPSRLFDAAREAGLLFQLDLATRRLAVRNAAAGGLEGTLLINFSPTSVYDPATCLRSTVDAVDAAGFPHERVVFELVETEQVNDPRHLQRILRFYREAGFGIALDDVGSGYSSLNVLHQLRPDYLKLDMELVRGVHEDPFKAVIASKVLEIAQRLGIAAIAEGIETAEELAWVRAHGATHAQGYFLGRPAPAGQARARCAAADAT